MARLHDDNNLSSEYLSILNEVMKYLIKIKDYKNAKYIYNKELNSQVKPVFR